MTHNFILLCTYISVYIHISKNSCLYYNMHVYIIEIHVHAAFMEIHNENQWNWTSECMCMVGSFTHLSISIYDFISSLM